MNTSIRFLGSHQQFWFPWLGPQASFDGRRGRIHRARNLRFSSFVSDANLCVIFAAFCIYGDRADPFATSSSSASSAQQQRIPPAAAVGAVPRSTARRIPAAREGCRRTTTVNPCGKYDRPLARFLLFAVRSLYVRPENSAPWDYTPGSGKNWKQVPQCFSAKVDYWCHPPKGLTHGDNR